MKAKLRRIPKPKRRGPKRGPKRGQKKKLRASKTLTLSEAEGLYVPDGWL